MRMIRRSFPCTSARNQAPGRGLLADCHAELEAQRSEIRRRYHEIDVERSPELMEQSQIVARNETSARQIEHDRRQLRAIGDALARMNAGEFGICGRCSSWMSEARLRAVPAAEYCRDCQEAVEAEERLETEVMLARDYE